MVVAEDEEKEKEVGGEVLVVEWAVERLRDGAYMERRRVVAVDAVVLYFASASSLKMP